MIVDELVLVGRIDGAGEELELTTDTFHLLSEDGTVTLTRVSRGRLPRGLAVHAQAMAHRITIRAVACVVFFKVTTSTIHPFRSHACDCQRLAA